MESDLYDWEAKVMKAIQEGNNWQFTASVYGLMQVEIGNLTEKVKELERIVAQINDPLGH